MIVGDTIPEWVVESVPAEKMKTMALLLRDPNPIHWDVDAVQRLGLGDRVINQGPTNQAYVINMLLSWLEDPARLKSIRVRFVGNVLAGDRVVAGGKVTALRNDAGLPVADCEVWLEGDDGARLMSGTAVVAV